MNEEPKDSRMAATVVVGAASLGMLTLCVPLVWIIGSPLLAYLTVGSFAVGTAGIWAFGKPRKAVNKAQEKEIKELKATVDSLKERLEDVEVMSRFEAGLAERGKGKSGGAETGMGDEEMERE